MNRTTMTHLETNKKETIKLNCCKYWKVKHVYNSFCNNMSEQVKLNPKFTKQLSFAHLGIWETGFFLLVRALIHVSEG